MALRVAFVAASLAVLTACGEAGDPGVNPGAQAQAGQETGGAAPAAASASPSASAAPTARAGTVETGAGGTITFACSGQGEPAIVLEAGSDSAGTEQYSSLLLDPLAERTTVCTYDRPGTGSSRDLPDHRRTLDDVCQVQDEVIDALGITAPYVLLGQSAGGNMVIGCAQRHPDRLAGLVVVEGYHDDPRQMREWQKEEGWTWQTNVEHLDYLDITDELDAVEMPVGEFPVLVLTATDADPGNVENQAFWLGLSPDSRQVVVEGGHDLHDENPAVVVEETLAVLGG